MVRRRFQRARLWIGMDSDTALSYFGLIKVFQAMVPLAAGGASS
jgi:hypothetical protein